MSQMTLAMSLNNLKRLTNSSAFLVLSLIGFVALIIVITLLYSTSQVTKGYVLKSLESRHQDLLRELEVHDMQISRVRALQNIEGSAKVNRMVRPGVISYLNGDLTIASK